MPGSGQQGPRFLGASPQFRVTDLVRTAEHYRDVLGFSVDGYFGDPPIFTEATRDAATIQLGLAPDAAQATRPAGGAGLNAYVWVDDVDRLALEYRASGARIVEGPVDRSYLCRELVVKDCNDLVLCFAQDLSRAGSGSS